jgi:hypothetical protein
MVVPRSSVQVAQDEEFVLFAVATFRKYSAEFLNKCREQKWTPRQYKHVEGGKEEEQRELDRVTNEERKVCGEALRMGRTGWSESVMVWVHVLTLRVFVETVLRYGLPLSYVSALVKVICSLSCCPDSAAPSRVHAVTFLLTTSNRPRRSSRVRSRRHWTPSTHTSEEMPSDGTSGAG